MIILFLFFVLPLSTILLAIVLQKILKSPILVAITFFAIYLIAAFIAFPSNLAVAIIAVIIYTIIAFITAFLVQLFKTLREKLSRCNNDSSDESNSCCTCRCNSESNNDDNCCCNRNNNNNNENGVSVTANVVPCNNNGGRTGCIRGCWRRF